MVSLFKTVLFFLSCYCCIIFIFIKDSFGLSLTEFPSSKFGSMWLIGSKEVENVKSLQSPHELLAQVSQTLDSFVRPLCLEVFIEIWTNKKYI